MYRLIEIAVFGCHSTQFCWRFTLNIAAEWRNALFSVINPNRLVVFGLLIHRSTTIPAHHLLKQMHELIHPFRAPGAAWHTLPSRTATDRRSVKQWTVRTCLHNYWCHILSRSRMSPCTNRNRSSIASHALEHPHGTRQAASWLHHPHQAQSLIRNQTNVSNPENNAETSMQMPFVAHTHRSSSALRIHPLSHRACNTLE